MKVCELCLLRAVKNRKAFHLDVIIKAKDHKYIDRDYVKMDLCKLHFMLNKDNIEDVGKEVI